MTSEKVINELGLDSDALFMAGKVKMRTNPDSNLASGTFPQLQYTNGCDVKDEISTMHFNPFAAGD